MALNRSDLVGKDRRLGPLKEKLSHWLINWAYDIDKDVISNGEIFDQEVIDQSIEMILGTSLGSRLFNIGFGSNFSYKVFSNMTSGHLERVLDDTVKAIKRWDDRIIIIEDNVRIVANTDQHSILLTIPYIIKNTGEKAVFNKKFIE